MPHIKRSAAGMAGAVGFIVALALLVKGRGKGLRWYMRTPLYAYRLIRHWSSVLGKARRTSALRASAPRPWRPQWLPPDTVVRGEADVTPHIPEEAGDLFLIGGSRGATELEVLNWLHATACFSKPINILETGAFEGAGTIALASACKANGFGTVHAVENVPEFCDRLTERLTRLGLSQYVRVHCQDSREFLRETNIKFQFGFFDSWNPLRPEEYRICMERRLLEGIAAFHDTSPHLHRNNPDVPFRQEEIRASLIQLASEYGATGYLDSHLSRGLFVIFNSPIATTPETHRKMSRPLCKCCSVPARFFGSVSSEKNCMQIPPEKEGFPVSYYRCSRCGFLFTPDFDEWTPADFQARIYNDDYLTFDPEFVEVRPRKVAEKYVQGVLGAKTDVSILDYGGGEGKTAVFMREFGFHDVTVYDPYWPDQSKRPTRQFDVVTCFEVIEHSPDPFETLADIRRFLKPGGLIIMCTGYVPPDLDEQGLSWWYVAPRNGHISLFTQAGMTRLAEDSGLHLFDRIGGLHLMTSDPERWRAHLPERPIGTHGGEPVLPRLLRRKALQAATKQFPDIVQRLQRS